MNGRNELVGVVLSVNVSKVKGVKKVPQEQIILVENHGVLNDAHAGNWHRQVSMLSKSSIDKARIWGIEVSFGDFAENITVDGVDVWKLPIGTKVYINDAVLEVTQIGKECHDRCAIARMVGKCVMPVEGIFLRVLKGGTVKPNDRAVFVLPE
ncbi:molybdenum cofactor sulfurase [Thermotoga sp. Ku-13t]|uniref:MOSC domain-containing protein n=1 Tax=Thermotoga sp. Ku-13t TaxID=1755813 RepID=UPI0013E9E338|nr:MOSC domain-containing protein [Thermotoga sp. Ku-13t]KAF2957793.1 molybdenum cofactor sulfurase [Thermotoga sp. Ku-13t]